MAKNRLTKLKEILISDMWLEHLHSEAEIIVGPDASEYGI